jgi:hypothetical protein
MKHAIKIHGANSYIIPKVYKFIYGKYRPNKEKQDFLLYVETPQKIIPMNFAGKKQKKIFSSYMPCLKEFRRCC